MFWVLLCCIHVIFLFFILNKERFSGNYSYVNFLFILSSIRLIFCLLS